MNRKSGWLVHWKQKAQLLKTHIYAIALAYRDPRVPWYAKVCIAVVLAYAFSPIDLIPDFIPVLGYLDDLVLIPLGISLALKMIPPEVMEESRQRAAQHLADEKPVNWTAAVVIILLWLLSLGWCMWLILKNLRG